MDFIDLKTQYKTLKASIDARIQKVLDHGQYVLGPEVARARAAASRPTSARSTPSRAPAGPTRS